MHRRQPNIFWLARQSDHRHSVNLAAVSKFKAARGTSQLLQSITGRFSRAFGHKPVYPQTSDDTISALSKMSIIWAPFMADTNFTFDKICVALIAVISFLILPQPALAENVDVEIVLAVDVSGSVSQSEYILQMHGYADAFHDPSVQAAILSGPHGKVAVAMVIWADAAFPKYTTRWYLLNSAATAETFAAELQRLGTFTKQQSGIGGGGTGIGDGVRLGIQLIRNNRFEGVRKVVDVSGDGVETEPWFKKAVTMPEAKILAAEFGIIINGLAILTDFPTLDDWYRDNVIFGPGSFVIEARSFETFGASIKRKLQREFSHIIVKRCDCDVDRYSRHARNPFHRNNTMPR